MRIVTMGVYGFDEASFVEIVKGANVDVFVDTRRRRAVRGSKYAFANSVRLQSHLSALDIRYVHRLELAPSNAARQAQDQADSINKIRRSEREGLTEPFISAYTNECLEPLNSQQFVASLGPDLQSILIFCVERSPAACHRGLLANKLARDLGAKVEHIVP